MRKKAVSEPGTVLQEQYLDEYGIPAAQLAADIGLSVSAVRNLLANKARISLHIAKRLAKYFSTTVEYWYGIQTEWDLAELEKDEKLASELAQISKAKKPSAAVKKAVAEKKAAASKKTVETKTTGKRGASKKTEAVAKEPARRGRKPKAEKLEAAPEEVRVIRRRGRKPKEKPAVEAFAAEEQVQEEDQFQTQDQFQEESVQEQSSWDFNSNS
jgi:addiction module HigA family antidote